jgi:hypothetical protein
MGPKIEMTNKNRNIITVLAINASTIMGILVSTYMQQVASLPNTRTLLVQYGIANNTI